MMFLGFLSAGLTATWFARRVGIPGEVIWDLGIWVLVRRDRGSAGCFIWCNITTGSSAGKPGSICSKPPLNCKKADLVLLGGVLCSSAVVVGYCYYRKLKPLLIADIAVPGFFLALAFGRVGCLMNGCCYGDRCELPWAIQFPLGSVPDMALVMAGLRLARQSVEHAAPTDANLQFLKRPGVGVSDRRPIFATATAMERCWRWAC